MAHGPGFKEKTEVKPFENIEIYNLMCGEYKLDPLYYTHKYCSTLQQENILSQLAKYTPD